MKKLLSMAAGGLALLGAPVSTVDELDMHKTYAIYNPHFTTYAVSNLTQTENLWAAGMTGDAGHNLANEACAQPYDRFSSITAHRRCATSASSGRAWTVSSG